MPWTDFINIPGTLFRGLETLDQGLQRAELLGNIDLLNHDKPVFSGAGEILLLYVEPGRYLGLWRQQPLRLIFLEVVM